MNNSFNPPWYLKNAHVQTILNSIGPRRFQSRRVQKQLSSEHKLLTAKDGTELSAEFDKATHPGDSIAILLHGWEGSSQSSYLVLATRQLLEMGFDVLRINLRDHGDSHHLNRELFNSTRSPEVASAMASFLNDYSYGQVFLGGYSLGGSFALRIANDSGRSLGIKAVAAICPPVDPANAMAAMNTGWFVYEKYFFHKWSRSLKIKLHHFPELAYGEELARAQSLDELNDFFIPRFTDFDAKGSYFSAYALSGDRLSDLKMPAYIIASADDPIIPVADFETINTNPMLTINIQSRGGHCGFIENLSGDSWADNMMKHIFASHRS